MGKVSVDPKKVASFLQQNEGKEIELGYEVLLC